MDRHDRLLMWHMLMWRHMHACRGVVTMEQPCMRAYSLLLIKTCHRRGIHAMGGMAAQIPVKNNPQANETALAKVQDPLVCQLFYIYFGRVTVTSGSCQDGCCKGIQQSILLNKTLH